MGKKYEMRDKVQFLGFGKILRFQVRLGGIYKEVLQRICLGVRRGIEIYCIRYREVYIFRFNQENVLFELK